MPRFFFQIDGFPNDDEGVEVESLARAKCEAVDMAGRLICEESNTFWEKKEWSMTVADARGLTLFALTFFATESAALAD